ncbi:WLM domain-containing protein [Lyophyllum atratum]|nr:WLM domain-containing protein [Lyophyllum atratum]
MPVGGFDAIVSNPHLAWTRQAQHLLERVARLMRPVMLANNLSANLLLEGTCSRFAEMADCTRNAGSATDGSRVLGLSRVNQAGVREIYLRLRRPGDISHFLEEVQICDTLMHELTHNIHGHHKAPFRAMWHRLRLEFLDLMNSGVVHVNGFGPNDPPQVIRWEPLKGHPYEYIFRGSGRGVGPHGYGNHHYHHHPPPHCIYWPGYY